MALLRWCLATPNGTQPRVFGRRAVFFRAVDFCVLFPPGKSSRTGESIIVNCVLIPSPYYYNVRPPKRSVGL